MASAKREPVAVTEARNRLASASTLAKLTGTSSAAGWNSSAGRTELGSKRVTQPFRQRFLRAPPWLRVVGLQPENDVGDFVAHGEPLTFWSVVSIHTDVVYAVSGEKT